MSCNGRMVNIEKMNLEQKIVRNSRDIIIKCHTILRGFLNPF